MRASLRLLFFLFIISFGFWLFAQDGDSEPPEEALPEPTGSLIDPLFPARNTALVQFEAEEAVSTNFATAATLNYGVFVNNVISFLIVAFAVFLLIKSLNALKRKEEEKPPPPTPSAEEKLLTEIRDVLKQKA